MRKIFSSQRVENAEGVAQMLREAGIEARISNGRSYHSKRRGQFSYLDQKNDDKLPTVWVVRADDQARAREILRDARLQTAETAELAAHLVVGVDAVTLHRVIRCAIAVDQAA